MYTRLIFAAVLAVLVVAPAASAVDCETYPNPQHNFQAATRGNTSSQIPFNHELGDYGLIFEDAKWRECSGGSWLSQPPYDGVKHGAYEALMTKITTTMGPTWDRQHVDFQNQLVKPFQGWLEGGFVTLIFSTAMMIGGHGDLDSNLDNALQKVAQSFVPTLGGPGKCGFYQRSGWNGGGDTCMEEHVTAASAYAWIAAYESKRRGFWAGQPWAVKANEQIAAAFSTYDSICISDRTQTMDAATRGPCNINIAPSDPNYLTTLRTYLLPDPMNGNRTRADVLSFNRDQNIIYGVGQLGQISSALIALSEGGYNRNSGAGQPSLTAGEQLIAYALLDEAQRKTTINGTDAYFRSGECAKATDQGGVVVRHDAYGCSDTPPRAFAYNTRTSTSGWSSFFEKWVTIADYQPRASTVDHRVVSGMDIYTTINPAFQFNSFNDALFNRNTDYGSWGALNWGRYSVYKILGWTWNTIDSNRNVDNTWVPTSDKRPRLWADVDDNDPKGYLDGIDANGVATGWTCDRDKPTKSTYVDFYVDGGGLGTFVQRVQANYGNEPAVTTECNGGYYHRFQAQLPSWTKGHYVYAWGLDATWRGVAVLPGWQCPSTYPACVW